MRRKLKANWVRSGLDNALLDFCADCYDDPLLFVRSIFLWNEGELAGHTGPDVWQEEFLLELGRRISENTEEGPDGTAEMKAVADAVQMAVASGHGVGKSALVAWIILWFMSTRDYPQIPVTANTQTQLLTKTWRELSRWHRRAQNGHWFEWTATRFSHKAFSDSWFAAAIPWSKQSSEAFAGTHEKHVLVIMDEASAIPDMIWEVVRGDVDARSHPPVLWKPDPEHRAVRAVLWEIEAPMVD